jgi:hypothetical protein
VGGDFLLICPGVEAPAEVLELSGEENMKRISVGLAFFLTVFLSGPAFADYVIKLKNGRTVETAKCWEEEGQVKFRWEEGIASLPKKNVVSIEWVDEKFPSRAFRPNPQDAEPKQVLEESPKAPGKKVEPALPQKASPEINIEQYKKKKAQYVTKYEQAYQRYLDATSRRDPEAKKKAWEEFNNYGGEVVKMETELRKRNNGKVPSWWKEETVKREE